MKLTEMLQPDGGLIYEAAKSQEVKVEALEAEVRALRAVIQFAYDNLHRWTGTTGPGCADWTEQAREVLAYRDPI